MVSPFRLETWSVYICFSEDSLFEAAQHYFALVHCSHFFHETVSPSVETIGPCTFPCLCRFNNLHVNQMFISPRTNFHCETTRLALFFWEKFGNIIRYYVMSCSVTRWRAHSKKYLNRVYIFVNVKPN